MIKTKKGVSPIIATILLILISVAALTLIMAFVVPFIQKQLKESKECFNIPEQIQIIDDSKYTCFDPTAGDMKVGVGIKRSKEEGDIGGFKISIESEDEGKVVEIIEGEIVNNVFMLDGSDVLEIPGLGEERTYVIKTDLNIIKVRIAPILKNGRLCKVADEIEIPECLPGVTLLV